MQTDSAQWFMFAKSVADRPPPEGPPEVDGAAFIVNSATHKYVRPSQDSDVQAFLTWGSATPVTSQQVTLDCGLAVPVDAWVEAEWRNASTERADDARPGWGDRLASIFRFFGVGRSCAGCEARRNWLNRLGS